MLAHVFRLPCSYAPTPGSWASAALVRLLRIGPASPVASKAIGYLEAMGLSRPHPGELAAEAASSSTTRSGCEAFQAGTGAHAEVAAAARDGIEIFGSETPAGARLGRMAD